MKNADSAVSEIVGAALLLAVSVLLAAIVAVGLHREATRAPQDATRVDFGVRAIPGATSLRLLHMGGPSIQPGDLRVVVRLNATIAYDAQAPYNGSWSLGDAIDVGPLLQAIPPGSLLDVTLASQAHGTVLADKSVLVPASTSTPLTSAPPAVNVTLAGGRSSVVLSTPGSLLVNANVTHPLGRKYVRDVSADITQLCGANGVPLRDDGAGADALADDGTYSALVIVPANFQSGNVRVNVTAVDVFGNAVTRSANVTILVRQDVNELAANPTQEPVNGTSPSCPADDSAIRDVQVLVGGATPVARLAGNTVQGENVTVFYATDPACPSVTVSLVAYESPGPIFNFSAAPNDTVYSQQTVSGAGQFILNVNLPSCYYTVDLVRGNVIASLGPDTTNNYYSRQARLVDTDNGGANPC